MAKRTEQRRPEPGDMDRPMISNGPGAGDNNSGGGNATGIPDGDTGMSTDVQPGGDVEEDRRKLFPEQGNRKDRPKA